MPLRELLARSAATAAFHAAVEEFLRTGAPNAAVAFEPFAPAVKVERTLSKLLEAEPELPIERVELRGSSGCEFYRGELRVESEAGERHVRFEWNCRWRAVEQGWTDYFGFPDQARAAREFGYDCFRVWQPLAEPGG